MNCWDHQGGDYIGLDGLANEEDPPSLKLSHRHYISVTTLVLVTPLVLPGAINVEYKALQCPHRISCLFIKAACLLWPIMSAWAHLSPSYQLS